MNLIQMPSPNFDSRHEHTIDILVLHYTGMTSAEAALERLCNPTANVSAHYVVDEHGNAYQLVAETNRAWHAGISSWHGNNNINQRSIGIEIVNPGHEFGYSPFPMKQMETVATLCQNSLSRHAIPAHNIIGHSDIAPTRKKDPGELFDWQWLATQGIGIWPTTTTSRAAPPHLLEQYGYDISDLTATITAFQRHFSPQNLSGTWNNECGQRLQSLLDSTL